MQPPQRPFIALLLLTTGLSTAAEQSKDTTQDANNPTAPLFQLQIQNWYDPSLYGARGESNTVLVRPFIPIDKIGRLPAQIARPEIPIVTTPDGRTALGDISGFDLFFLVDRPGLRWGLGPTFTFPTATYRAAGQGLWQAGPASALIYTGLKGRVIGILAQNPISFAGERRRPAVNTLSLQPILVQNLPHAWFLRSDPILNFDWKYYGTASVPVNLGIGRVFHLGPQLINAYVQPEWNVRRPNAPYSVPQFTLRFAVHLLYPKGERP